VPDNFLAARARFDDRHGRLLSVVTDGGPTVTSPARSLGFHGANASGSGELSGQKPGENWRRSSARRPGRERPSGPRPDTPPGARGGVAHVPTAVLEPSCGRHRTPAMRAPRAAVEFLTIPSRIDSCSGRHRRAADSYEGPCRTFARERLREERALRVPLPLPLSAVSVRRCQPGAGDACIDTAAHDKTHAIDRAT